MFRRGEKSGWGRERSCVQGEDVERMCIDLEMRIRSIDDRRLETYLCYSSAEKAPHQEFEALQFRLYDDQFEARLWIHVSCLILDELNLLVWLGANPAVVQAPTRHGCSHTCLLNRSNTLSINPSGQASISGATRSETQQRVNSCKSRVSRGVVSTAMSARMSSMSMALKRVQECDCCEREQGRAVEALDSTRQ
jgi:hypothetical protein